MNRKDEKWFESLNVKEGGSILITGGNSGIGFECTRYLLRKKWTVYWGIRNLEKGEIAKAKLLEEFPDACINILHLDLASLPSIHSFCEEFKQKKIDIDAFYSNAGIYRMPFKTLYAGLESQVAVNFVSNIVLFEELFDTLKGLGHPVKYILTSSIVARLAKFDESSFFGRKKYNKAKSYNCSKTGLNMFYMKTLEVTKNTTVLPLLVHPGIVYTPLIEKAYHGKVFLLAAKRFMRAFFNKPNRGAMPALHVLQEDITQSVFCGPKGIAHSRGLPKVYPLYQGNLKNKDEILDRAHELILQGEKDSQ